jgi:hypothetical protein
LLRIFLFLNMMLQVLQCKQVYSLKIY